MLYATVNGERMLPQPRSRGTCPTCKSDVVAKCGRLVTWHWAHAVGAECDPWSEPIGPWHLSWQSLVTPDRVEVVMGPHRADVLAHDDVVIELQHSSIDADSIAARESFYGNMIWLFDATFRFTMSASGDIVFFHLGRTKHIECCTKSVYLDFGDMLVEVIKFSPMLLEGYSGVGRIRTRDWFINRFFRNYLNKHNADVPVIPARARERWHRLDTVGVPTTWIEPGCSTEYTLPIGSPIHRLNYRWILPSSEQELAATRFIATAPELANGWTEETMQEMLDHLRGYAAVVEGRLRIIPVRGYGLYDHLTPTQIRDVLPTIDAHIAAGRLPVMDDRVRNRLLAQAEEHQRRYVQPNVAPPRTRTREPEPELFDRLPPRTF